MVAFDRVKRCFKAGKALGVLHILAVQVVRLLPALDQGTAQLRGVIPGGRPQFFAAAQVLFQRRPGVLQGTQRQLGLGQLHQQVLRSGAGAGQQALCLGVSAIAFRPKLIEGTRKLGSPHLRLGAVMVDRLGKLGNLRLGGLPVAVFGLIQGGLRLGFGTGQIKQGAQIGGLRFGSGTVLLFGSVIGFMRGRGFPQLVACHGKFCDARIHLGAGLVQGFEMRRLNRAFQVLDPLLQVLNFQPLFLAAPGHGGKGRAGLIEAGANVVQQLVVRRPFARCRPGFENRIGLRNPVRQRPCGVTGGVFLAEMPQVGAQKAFHPWRCGVQTARPFQAETLANGLHGACPIRHQPVVRGKHPRLPAAAGLGLQHMAQPQQQTVVSVVIAPVGQRIRDILRVAVDADKGGLAVCRAQRPLPERQQTADAGVLQDKQMRPPEVGPDRFPRPFQEFVGLGRSKPVGRDARKAEPPVPGRGEQAFVETGDPVGFEKAPDIDFCRRHQVLRQVASHLPQHPGQGRGARAVHAQHHHGGSGAGGRECGMFLAGCHHRFPGTLSDYDK